MSITLALVVVAAVVAGLYVFVPQVHTALLGAFNVARDDLSKIVADGEALVARLETHSKHQAKVAAKHAAVAATATAAAAEATDTAGIAAASAASLKASVSGIRH